LVIVFIVGFFAQFYRDPERIVPHEEGILVSPADGRVIEISTVRKGMTPTVEKNGEKIPLPELSDYVVEDMTMIVIFMNPFDVHVNRSPVSGTIKRIIYVPGSFFSASTSVYAVNERNIFVIDGEERFIVIQVAGRFVRRISSYKKEGERVELGERIGMISFGSQVVVLFPQDYVVFTSVGNRVYAGETILARKRHIYK